MEQKIIEEISGRVALLTEHGIRLVNRIEQCRQPCILDFAKALLDHLHLPVHQGPRAVK